MQDNMHNENNPNCLKTFFPFPFHISETLFPWLTHTFPRRLFWRKHSHSCPLPEHCVPVPHRGTLFAFRLPGIQPFREADVRCKVDSTQSERPPLLLDQPTYLNQMFFSGIKVNKRAVLYFSRFFSPSAYKRSFLPQSIQEDVQSKKWTCFHCVALAGFWGASATDWAPLGASCWAVLAGRTHRGVFLVIPAQDKAVLSLHLLHSVFSDLMEQITWQNIGQRRPEPAKGNSW